MKTNHFLFAFFLLTMPCVAMAQIAAPNTKPIRGSQKETVVQISTEYGIIKMKLYNETPIHRDNFLKLAKAGTYNGSIFHRVIAGFMIQGGGSNGGADGFGETLTAEINPKFSHKRGALAAARMGDNVNPEKKSSGSQFYIVQGRVFLPDEIESIMTRMAKKYTDEQKNNYITIGGAPHLDGEYTVFGEVTEGMEVVDKIAKVEKSAKDSSRPAKDIPMTVTVLE